QVRRPADDEVHALRGSDLVDLFERRELLDHDGQRDLPIRMRHVLGERYPAEIRGAAARHHAALAERGVAHRLDRLARFPGAVDMRQLQTLHAHIKQAQDERGIEAWSTHDRRDAHALGGHDHQLHVAQVEARVLHVDEGRVESRMAYDLDDLRIGDAAHVRSERQPAFTQYSLDPVSDHDFDSFRTGERETSALTRSRYSIRMPVSFATFWYFAFSRRT